MSADKQPFFKTERGDTLNGNCHFIFGASVGASLAMNIDKLDFFFPRIMDTPEMAVLFVMGGLLGGVFPDIDNPTSYVGKLTAPVSRWLGKVSAAMGKEGWNHRGILHDPIVYLIGLFLCTFQFTPLIGFFVGCLSHLFLDMFNPVGIPFLFGVKHLRLAKIPSSSKQAITLTWIATGAVFFAGLAGCFYPALLS